MGSCAAPISQIEVSETKNVKLSRSMERLIRWNDNRLRSKRSSDDVHS